MEIIATFIDQWFDPVSLGIVLGGTLLATLLRCGLGEVRLALSRAAGLLSRSFDPAPVKAALAIQVEAISREGALRAKPALSGDTAFDCLSEMLARGRPLDIVLGANEQQQQRRTQMASKAVHVFHQAAELAPVLGLAGTLIALGAIPTSGAETSIAGSVAMAVVTTLYGLAAANFLFGPLAAAIDRRAKGEEDDRQAVVDWLVHAMRRHGAPARLVTPVPAEVSRLAAEVRKVS